MQYAIVALCARCTAVPVEFDRLGPELTGGFALTEPGELGLHPFQLLGIRLGLLEGLDPSVFGPLVHRQYGFRSCSEGAMLLGIRWVVTGAVEGLFGLSCQDCLGCL